MAKLNYERPSLKYIDNLQREIKKASAKLSSSSIQSSSKTNNRCVSLDLPNIDLTLEEYEKIYRVLRLLGKQVRLESKFITSELFSIKNKLNRRQKAEIKENFQTESSKLRISMIQIAIQLVASERIQTISGREKGVLEWFNLWGKALSQNGLADTWSYMHDDIFSVAIEIYKEEIKRKTAGNA